MKIKLGMTAVLGAFAVAALVAGGCANDNATTCDNDKACTDKGASCCGSASKAKATTDTKTTTPGAGAATTK